MNKSDIVSALSLRHPDYPHSRCSEAVEDIFDIMHHFIVHGGGVNVANFGSFRSERMGARKTRNPRTGETTEAGPCLKVRFKPSARLKGGFDGERRAAV